MDVMCSPLCILMSTIELTPECNVFTAVVLGESYGTNS